MILFGIKDSQLLVFNIHLPSQVVIKALESPIEGPLSAKQYMGCHPAHNCLRVVHRCSFDGQICVFVVPPIKMIMTIDHSLFKRYFDPHLDVRHPIQTALFADEKKFVIVHNVSFSKGTVHVAIFHFDEGSSTTVLLQQMVLLSKPKHRASVADLVLGDQTRTRKTASVFQAFVFRRFFLVHVCLVYVDLHAYCFALKEPHMQLPLLLQVEQQVAVKSIFGFLKKGMLLVAGFNFLILIVLWKKAKRVDYRLHLFSKMVRHTAKY